MVVSYLVLIVRLDSLGSTSHVAPPWEWASASWSTTPPWKYKQRESNFLSHITIIITETISETRTMKLRNIRSSTGLEVFWIIEFGYNSWCWDRLINWLIWLTLCHFSWNDTFLVHVDLKVELKTHSYSWKLQLTKQCDAKVLLILIAICYSVILFSRSTINVQAQLTL